jgi:uncharacterized RDD family membrane protein YckC
METVNEEVVASSSNNVQTQTTLHLADSLSRIIAFIVDIVLYALIVGIIGAIISGPFQILQFSILSTADFNNFARQGVLISQSDMILKFIMSLVSAAIWFGYYVFVPSRIYNGETIGKRIMRIRIVRTNGAKVDLGDMLKRNILYIVSTLAGGIPLLVICFCCVWFLIPFINVIMLFVDDKRQTLNDKIADTIVVES